MRGKHVFDKNPTFDNPVFTISLENVNEHVVAEERDQDQVCRSNPGDNMTIDSRSRTAKWNLLAEVLITCTACTSLILIELGLIPNYRKSGFYCDDPNIRFKYSGQTIGTKILLLVTTILPLISITTIERCCHGPEGYAKRGGGRWAWLTQSLRWYKEFLSGLIIVIFVTEVAKLTIGEPRPHFIDTCRPIQAMNCSSGYISEYTCTNKDVSLHSLIDASRSFPSGHASVSFYLFIFMAWFIERRVTSVGQLVIAWLQISVLVWTLLCSLTRITDHKHHWWDVLAGSILGVLVGQYIVKKFCKDFQLTMYHGHISGAKHIENKASRQLYNNNTSARRLLTSASGYNNEPPTRDQSDQSLT